MTKLSPFDEFVARFETLKSATKNDPKRLTTFYKESRVVRDAADALDTFLLRTDFERRVFHGPHKYFSQVPKRFESVWQEYDRAWKSPFLELKFEGLADILNENLSDAEPSSNTTQALETPDPHIDSTFDPLYHNGAAALQLGMSYLEDQANLHESGKFEDDERVENLCRISLSAYDYLQKTIGIDPEGVFRRWREVPVIFMPNHVSNRYGHTEKGSLYALLDDAVRAYVSGAPAAAVAMCRAVLEMVLKNHYLMSDQITDQRPGLGKLIVLASERYTFINRSRVFELSESANKILHNYATRQRIANEDERIIVDFLVTVKTLIQRAPK